MREDLKIFLDEVISKTPNLPSYTEYTDNLNEILRLANEALGSSDDVALLKCNRIARHLTYIKQHTLTEYGHSANYENLLLVINQLSEALNKIIPRNDLVNELEENAKQYSENELRRYQEQKAFHQSSVFEEFLKSVKAFANENRIAPTQIFISYSWPILGFLGEDKTQKFLMKLVEHLTATGLTVYIDESQEGAKQQIHDFQRRILDVDHVLVFCSRTLYYKFHCMKRVGAVSEYELYANYEFRSPPDHVIPLQWNKTFYGPPTVKTHDAGISIYQVGYLGAFITLLKRVYGFGKNFDRWYEQQAFRQDLKAITKEYVLTEKPVLPRPTSIASSRQAASLFNVPRENEKFVGREAKLREIDDALNDLHARTFSAISVLHGLGGVGKSQLALRYVYNHQDEYANIFWFYADNVESLKAQYKDFGFKLGLFTEDTSLEKAIEDIKEHLEKTNESWLAIFDNSTDYDGIADLLPSRNGKIIITSRNINWKVPDRIIKLVEVNTFDLDESVKFIVKQTGIATEIEACKTLSDNLGHLPLALAQACAYINNKHRVSTNKISTYLELYERHRKRLLKENNLSKVNIPVTAVAVTWDVTVSFIKEQYPNAVELLNFLSYVHPDQIPNLLINEFLKLKAITDQLELNDLINALIDYSMIQIISDDKYSIHRLVQEVMRDKHNIEQSTDYLSKLGEIVEKESQDLESDSKKTKTKNLYKNLEHALNLVDELLDFFRENAK